MMFGVQCGGGTISLWILLLGSVLPRGGNSGENARQPSRFVVFGDNQQRGPARRAGSGAAAVPG